MGGRLAPRGCRHPPVHAARTAAGCSLFGSAALVLGLDVESENGARAGSRLDTEKGKKPVGRRLHAARSTKAPPESDESVSLSD